MNRCLDPQTPPEKTFRGSKHLLTRYLEDFGRLGISQRFCCIQIQTRNTSATCPDLLSLNFPLPPSRKMGGQQPSTRKLTLHSLKRTAILPLKIGRLTPPKGNESYSNHPIFFTCLCHVSFREGNHHCPLIIP